MEDVDEVDRIGNIVTSVLAQALTGTEGLTKEIEYCFAVGDIEESL